MNRAELHPPARAPHAAEWVSALPGLVSAETVIKLGEPLARHTTLRVGGPADAFAEPASEEDLADLVRFCAERGVAFFVLGRGSNLLVRDGGYRGLVVSLAQPRFSRIEAQGEKLGCGAGARLKAVAYEARRLGLAGLEFLEGIPGTVGGALRMNAGAMGSATFEVLESARVMERDGSIREWPAGELRAVYRECALLKERIALSAVLRGQPGPREEIERRMTQYSQKRWQSQPAAPSAGCAFKNPVGIPAGKLIQELGLKGTRLGGAAVSLEHGNFIVNEGQASAADVLDLMELIRERARRERGIELEAEVEIIGEPLAGPGV